MKTNSTASEQSQVRRLAFEILTEYPDGKVPSNLDLQDLFKEIFQDRHSKSSDRKRAEEALHILTETARHGSSLNSEIAASVSPKIMEEADKFLQSLARLGLYELSEKNAPAELVFKDLLGLYRAYINRHETAEERLEKAERLLFPALFATMQYIVLLVLEEARGEKSPAPSVCRKLALKLGYDEELPLPAFAVQLASGILAHRELLDATLIKFFKSASWETLPSPLKNILRMGLYESLIGLASTRAIIDSLSALLNILLCQNDSLGGEEAIQTRNFINTKMLNSARSLGRALAFQIIYSLAFTDIRSLAALREAYAISPYNISATVDTGEKGDAYSWKLVRGVWEHASELDAIIDKYSHKWRVDRMGKIEITLLRLALYEMIYGQVPERVVINEIMDIADMFGAEDAKSLVNGILDAVSKSDEFHLARRSS